MQESEMQKLFNESKDAKISIDVDDYRVTLSGKLNPPVSQYDGDSAPYIYQDYDHLRRGLTARKSINLSLINPDDITIERVRWEIPLSVRPRIEND